MRIMPSDPPFVSCNVLLFFFVKNDEKQPFRYPYIELKHSYNPVELICFFLHKISLCLFNLYLPLCGRRAYMEWQPPFCLL
mgnify:CR=1 FL=1